MNIAAVPSYLANDDHQGSIQEEWEEVSGDPTVQLQAEGGCEGGWDVTLGRGKAFLNGSRRLAV